MDTVKRTINDNWKFHLGDCEPAWYKGFDDSGWQPVRLPHDWSVALPFDPKNSSGTGYVSGGIGWYRCRFSLPEEYAGKSVRLVFDGVYKNSQVWVNSYYLGKRPNGYVSFAYDITPFVSFGERDNEISVKVTHTDLADSRWFTGSGITRSVHLEIAEPVHPALYGIFFETKQVGADSALVQVTQELVNQTDHTARVGIVSRLVDEAGQTVLELRGETQAESGAEAVAVLSGTLKNPRLWSIEEPYLYRLCTDYCVDEGAFYRVDEESVGVRSIRFDADKGFFLNEKPMKIKGVCVHHDGGCLGAAMTAPVWQRRLSSLKESGCNAIRCSHNPHMPELYALCDRMGFVMMDEAFDEWENAKNKWSTGHNVYPPRHQGYFEDFPQWHEADLKAMVRRDRNHPSVILWSIGNEIDYPNDPYCHPMFETMTGNNDANKPAAERTYDPDKPNAERLTVLAARLAGMVRQEDTSRPVTLAAAFPELSSRIGFLDALDVAGYNYKEHLYEEDHKRFPKLPFLGSENGHSYAAWKAVRDNDYISGQFLWTGIDYLGEAHGWPIRGSQAGILTTAGDKKPGFYKTASFWKSEPLVRIATRPEDTQKQGREAKWTPVQELWAYEAGQRVTAECASNADSVALYLNGREIGRKEGCDEEGVFSFSLDYEPGELCAKAFDAEGREVAAHRLVTPGPAAKLACSLWQAEDALSGRSWEEAGQQPGYLYQLKLLLTDENGQPAVSDDREVSVSVSGPGELMGLENGDLSDVSAYSNPFRKTWLGRLTAYVRRNGAGAITVTVRSVLAGGEQTDEITVD
ncbi:MAG: glycoside hydrolase family 2 TIM barrel-domain containing protein [Eubacteriales bacterium]|nr:glycoside hydrolase family 2 TIM barrel-domain containing protein [Eubacteriales bacterium]